MTTEEIKALPKIVRLAGYLSRLAQLDACGARNRVAHQHESTDHDEKWTEPEDKEWEDLCDQLDPWWYALSEEDKKLLKPLELFMACLCRGEDPEEHIKLSFELIGKYAKSFPGTEPLGEV